MTIIDERGERQACDRCHKVRVRIRVGDVCEGCRESDRRWNRKVRQELRAMAEWVKGQAV